MRGAVREDDTTVETASMNTPAMGYDPVPVIDRAFRHFFDPINNKGIFTKWGKDGPTAPDWALVPGTELPDGVFSKRLNVYKITDAREAMWRALTLKDSALADVPFTSNVQGFDSVAEQREDERKAYWATTFRTLGDTIHLLQDMAQPQHTRDDKHSGFGCRNPTDPNAYCAGGHASFMELYLKARTLTKDFFTLDEAFLPPVAEGTGPERKTKQKQLDYVGYPKPTFANYRDFFATATGASSVTGRGLANYSNRGFYSFGTNIHSGSSFPNPSPTGVGLGTELLNDGSIEDTPAGGTGNIGLSGAVCKAGWLISTARTHRANQLLHGSQRDG